MGAIAEIFRQFGAAYLETFHDKIPATHRKVVEAITACRTEACGMTIYGCDQCEKPAVVFRSCGNRHCPT